MAQHLDVDASLRIVAYPRQEAIFLALWLGEPKAESVRRSDRGMKRRFLVLGPPAGGKGTVAERLAAELRIPHIATGDMLRQEVAEGSELGNKAKAFMDAGELVTDDLVVAMTVTRLARPDAADGWVVDGFPRDLGQAKDLHHELGDHGVDAVVALEVAPEEVIARISGRRMCSNGHVYHVANNPPKRLGICDVDGEALFQRDDDTEDVILNRIKVYEEESKPLFDFYDAKGVLRVVNGSGPPDEVYARLEAALGGDFTVVAIEGDAQPGGHHHA
ncbi:adenylate kinase [soil metagenome]